MAESVAETVQIGFVCVQNAGRSQMSTAFAEREVTERELGETVSLVTGGTDPAEHVHTEVVEVMNEIGIDLSDRTPQHVSTETLEACDVVVTMGCSTLELGTDSVDIRDWALTDPDGEGLASIRAVRDDIEHRVEELFDEIESEIAQ